MDNVPLDFTPCSDQSNLINAHLSRVTHNYANGANLRTFLTAYLSQLVQIEQTLCLLFDAFDVDTAVGRQLDSIGLIVGLDRTVCRVERFGDITQCSPGEEYALRDYTFESDDEYRKFVKASTYAYAFDGTLKQYERIVQFLYDDIDFDDESDVGTSRVLIHGSGTVNIQVDRALTDKELRLVDLYKTVLPYFGSYGVEVLAGGGFFVLTTDNNNTGLCNPMARSY